MVFLPTLKRSPKITMCGQELEVVDTFKYLGMVFQTDGRWDAMLGHRVEASRKALDRWRRVLGNTSIRVATRLQMYSTMVRSVMEYGAGVWYTGNPGRLETVERDALRCIFGAAAKTPTAILEWESGLLPIRAELNVRAMAFAARVKLMAQDPEARKRWVATVGSLEPAPLARRGFGPSSRRTHVLSVLKRYDLEDSFNSLTLEPEKEPTQSGHKPNDDDENEEVARIEALRKRDDRWLKPSKRWLATVRWRVLMTTLRQVRQDVLEADDERPLVTLLKKEKEDYDEEALMNLKLNYEQNDDDDAGDDDDDADDGNHGDDDANGETKSKAYVWRGPRYIRTLPGRLACFLFKMRAGVLPVMTERLRRRTAKSDTCPVCKAAPEDLAHFVHYCGPLNLCAGGGRTTRRAAGRAVVTACYDVPRVDEPGGAIALARVRRLFERWMRRRDFCHLSLPGVRARGVIRDTRGHGTAWSYADV